MPISTATFHICLDFMNSIDYCLRPEDYIKTSIEKIYVGKNYQNCKIMKFLELTYRGPAVNRKDTPDLFTVDVSFTAEVLTYNIGDIIPNVYVDNIPNTMTLAGSTDACQVTFITDRNVIAKGYIYPVRVTKVNYEIFKPFISIIGTVYLPGTLNMSAFRHSGEPIDKHILANIVHLRKMLSALQGDQLDIVTGFDKTYTYVPKSHAGTSHAVTESFNPGNDVWAHNVNGSSLTGSLIKVADSKGSKVITININNQLNDLYARMKFLYDMATEVTPEQISKYAALMVLAKKAREGK